MKVLKRIGIGLLAVILLIVIISFFLPRKVHVERSMNMNASPEAAFQLVNNLKMWNEWAPWNKMDPNTQWTYGEVTEGTGAWYTWKSEHPNVGSGKLTIAESKPVEYVKLEMDFMEHGKANAAFNYTPVPEGVKVTWSMDCDMGMNPIGKWMGLFMDGMLGKDFEAGLTSMKEIAEKTPVAESETVAGFGTEQREMGPMYILGVREVVKLKDLNSQKFAAWYEAIGKAMEKQKIKPAGAPMAIYHRYENNETEVEAAIPVESAVKDDGKVKYHELPATNALVVKYYGDYAKVEPVYNEAFAYIEKKGMKRNGPPMEVYITDPGMEKDTAKWLTEIIFPVQ